MDLDVSAAVKKFLIMFKLDHDFETELGNGDYIRTRDVSEQNLEIQNYLKTGLEKYKKS